MVTELINKISLLKEKLKNRNNKSYTFCDKLLNQINGGLVDEAVDSILISYAIIQYGDFNYMEEVLFEEIWNIAEKIKQKR